MKNYYHCFSSKKCFPLFFLVLSVVQTAFAQCNFTVSPSSANYGCYVAQEDVVWTSAVNVTATGNDLSKTAGGSSWNAGAFSTAKVYNNGYVETVVAETNTARMFGLSTTNPDANYTSIQYAIYLRSNATIVIYESGSAAGTFGSYITGDTLRIKVEQGRVNYYQNSTLLYMSAITPTFPLYADNSLNTVGATLKKVVIGNLSNGFFTATATTPGTGPSYQWKLNGLNVGANSVNYSNTSLALNDVLTCTITPGVGGCSASPVTSNNLKIRFKSNFNFGNFYITTTPVTSGCSEALAQVVWDSLYANVQVSGNNLTKIQGGNSWNGGAASLNKVSNNGYLQFTAGETNTARVVGLSNSNTGSDQNSIQYGIYTTNLGVVQIVESGSNKGTFSTYATGDVFKVAVEANVVKYYQNGNLLYISSVVPTLPLLVDVSINTVGGTISNAFVSNYTTGSFTAVATSAGSNPTYQWKLNGVNVGTNSSTYTNAALNVNDVITCTLTPNFNGCLSSSYASNSITYKTLSPSANMEVYLTSGVAASACNAAEENVKWKVSDLVNVQVTGNTLTKLLQPSGWNGGASSWNAVSNNGYLQFTATEGNTARMIGLSTTNADANFTSIQYAFYLQNNSTLGIYQSGTSLGNFGSYLSNDVFKIAVEGGVVKYYQNGILLYISGVAPTLPLIADVSLNTPGATITNAVVGNYSSGNYQVTALNAGTPTYQWKLNGGNVGTNSATYTNSTLANGDVLSCMVTPNINGCSTTTIATNNITNKTVSTPNSIDFFIQGDPQATACNEVQEQVVWVNSGLANVQATGNNLIKTQSNGNWDGAASSWNIVFDNGYFQFTATETDKSRMVGLSVNNANNSYTSIDYAVYLMNTGAVQIYELGVSKGTVSTYLNNDVFRIALESGVVKYYQNGSLIYLSSFAPYAPLQVDLSIKDVGGTVTNAIISNYNQGTFTAYANNAGSPPNYQWKLNGVNVGTNTSTYANAALNTNDQITCVLTPNLPGCSLATYNSNVLTYKPVTTNSSIEFVIQGTAAATACKTSEEAVVWTNLNMLNVQGIGNNLTKVQASGWNGGASSWNTVANNGYLQFTVSENNKDRIIGLSDYAYDANYTSIKYAFRLNNIGALQIYEAGNNRGTVSSYFPGDVLKISVESLVVKYYQNGNLLYISSVTPTTMPMLVDVSMNTTGSTITNAVVGNNNVGVFTATSTNSGSSPTYQWKLNGVNVGTNSTTYTNTTLAANDVVTCILTPNVTSCSTTYTSNSITNKLNSAPFGGTFYIEGSATAAGCNYSQEKVEWKVSDFVNVYSSAGTLTKLQGGNGFNGGAASWNTVKNNGYFQFIVAETNADKVVGLSTTNADATQSNIPFAFRLRGDASLRIMEMGNDLGGFGTCFTNDTLKISVESNVVKYYQNSTLLYISSGTPTLPLLVDVSLGNVGGTIQGAVVGNYNSGTFTATVANVGTSPTYQWKVNGANVGTNSAAYTNAALANNDIVTCALTPNLGGCSTSAYTSNTIKNKARTVIGNVDFYIQAVGTSTCNNTVEEQVKWKTADLTNTMQVTSTNGLLKLQSGGSWNGGASSWNSVANNGYLQFTATETNTARMIGLSTSSADDNYNTIQYAFYLLSNGTLRINELNSNRGTFGSYASGDILKISVESNVVKYYSNGVLLYQSAVVPTLPLVADVSMNTAGSTINNVTITNYNTTTFNATAINAGGSPSYQWKLNGVNVGTNSATYTNAGLVVNDVVSCVLTTSVSGCGPVNYNSNTVTNKYTPQPAILEFYVTSAAVASSCSYAEEDVSWKQSSLTNVQPTFNNLFKTTSNGNWDGGAASWNKVANNGYLQFTIAQTNKLRAVGLSTTDLNSNYTSIQYGFYLKNNATFQITESGTLQPTTTAFAVNDVFKIAVVAGVVKYYQNGTLIYTSAIAPTLPLLVDVSINAVGGTINNAVVGNYTSGSFAATALNAGTNPSYQWTLNGVNVGTNSVTYTNASVQVGDVVNCILTPDIPGCQVANVSSNNINIKSTVTSGVIEFYVLGTATTSACITTDEQVRWKVSDLSNVSANGNNLLKTRSNNSWDGGAASWNKVYNNGYFQFTISEINTARTVGLSTNNTDASNNTIQYAFYIVGNSVLRIRESGTDRGSVGTYASGDVLKIAVEAGVVKYYQNGVLAYISTVAPTLPMLADISINDLGGTITNAIISNYNTGTFTATATGAGVAPSYQWKLNGTNVGANSTTYTNTTLNVNDVISCVLTPDFGACSVPVTSNTLTNKSVANPIGIDFYIKGTVATTACSSAEEQVKWKISDLLNVSASTNNLTKIQSGGNWDGGAASWNTVANNGYLEFTATETSTSRMIGLSTTNVDADYVTIQYAFYLINNGTYSIRESGTNRGTFGTYATNDKFRIAVEAGVVKYYLNGALIYISTVTPTLPMLVDVSINTNGGTVTNAVVSNYNTGTFTATATGAGASPSYQWKLNGVNVGVNSATYTNTILNLNDVITCVLTPSLGGCTGTTYTSNTITNKAIANPIGIDFYIQGTVATTACNTVEEQVKWKVSDLMNVQATNNNLNKIQSNGNWDGGAASWNTVANNGYFQFTATETNTNRVVGLSTTNPDADYVNIQYAIYLLSNSTFRIYESGTSRGTFGTYATNDVFKIAVEASVVKYYQNGILQYISTLAPTLPLLVDVSINSVGGTVTNAVVSNYNTGVFTATATGAGASPTYQWKLNGANVGSNSATYTNTALNVNDIITCVLTPNLGGCSTTTYNSNQLKNNSVSNPIGIDFYVQGAVVATACNTADENVAWKISDLNNVTATSNNLTKVQSNGNWDGGAASWNTVANNGYLQFNTGETTTYKAIGLSSSNTDATRNTIQYAFYLLNNGAIQILESGNFRGSFGIYNPADVFKVSIESNTVKYYQNGTLLYISAIAPTLPMLVDVSIRDVGGTLNNVIVSNYNAGGFNATATNAGATPSYQWKLNGSNVGTNSSSYTNTLLAANDVITCVLTPSLGGCGTATYTSNSVTNKSVTVSSSIEFDILGSVISAPACTRVQEQVKWKNSDLLNVQATSNSLNKIQSNNSWDGGAASWNTVSDNGVFQFTASETNRSRMVGLSSTNLDASNTTIQYALYLTNTGVVQIFESGTNRGSFGAYAANDVFRIEVQSGVIKYYKNNGLLYTSTIAPILPLLIDVSIYSIGGSVTNALVSNLNAGTFTANATNAGATPTYQWKLNGSNVGTNSVSYTNAALANNDVITCVLTPSIPGCSASSTIASNAITNKPTIISPQPANQNACLGSNVTFNVLAVGSNISYQWRKGGVNIAGATSSSYNIPSVVAGDVGSYDVIVTTFGCLSSVANLTITTTNQWSGSVSTSWSNPSNWSCGLVPTSSTDVIIPSGVTNMPSNTGIANVKGLTINASAVLNNTSSGTMNIYGNFTGSGAASYVDRGLTAFVGSTAQTVTNVDSLHSVTVNNAAGVTLASSTYVAGYLTLTSGTLASGGNLTVDLNTGSIMGSGAGAISGNITVLKFIWSDQWHYISSPLSGRTVTEWNDDVLIKFGANSNLYYYDETVVNVSKDVGWTAITSTGAPIQDMKGYALYFPRWIYKTIVDVTGPYNHAQTYSNSGLTNTPSGQPLSDGWNLVGNPYPSVIDWSAASGWTKTGLDNAIYFWDQKNNRYASYVAGVGVNGGTRYIPAMQAFYVTVTNPGTATLAMNNNVRTTAANPDVWRIASEDNIIRLKVTTGSYTDESVIRMSEDATAQYDSQLDAHKLPNGGSTPSLSTKLANVDYAVNSVPSATMESTTIPVKLLPAVTGSYTLTADITGFADADSITLIDTVSHTSQDLLVNSSYTYDLVKGDTLTRLFINYKKKAKVVASTTDTQINSSTINIYGQEQTVNVLFDDQSTTANIVVYNVTGIVLYKAENVDVSSRKVTIKLPSVASGIYVVKVQTANASKTQQVFLNK